MLPTYASPSRRRRPGTALVNLGAMRRRIGENPRVVKLGLPALGLFFLGMVGTSFFSEVERLPGAENAGLHQAGEPSAHPAAHPAADSVPYTHQSQELQDWTSDGPAPAPAAAAATAAAVVTTAAVKPAAVSDVTVVPTGAHLDDAVDKSTIVDDHPWLVETGEKVATDLNEDAVALAKAEQRLVGQPLNEEAAKLAAEERDLVRSAESALAAEEKAVAAETELVGAKVAGAVVEAEEAMAPLEKEVTTVVHQVEREAGLVEAKFSGAARSGAAEIEVVESAAEEEVIVIVGTMEEMLFSWTFFGVFLFSLYRVSRKERKWWRNSKAGGHGGGTYDDEGGRTAGSPYALRYPREKLLTTPRRDHNGQSTFGSGAQGPSGLPSSSLFLDDDGGGKSRRAADTLDEKDRAALELGRLMLHEREAAQRMREQTAQAIAAQEAFSVSLNGGARPSTETVALYG